MAGFSNYSKSRALNIFVGQLMCVQNCVIVTGCSAMQSPTMIC